MLTNVTPTKKTSFGVTNAIFIGRSTRHSLRDMESLLMSISLPVMLMLIFTYVFGGAIDPSGNYVNYVVPGTIIICAAFGSSNIPVNVAEDMTNGIIDRFRTMPIRSVAVITGHIVAGVARNLLATILVFGVALLVGFRSSAGFWEWMGAVGVIALFILVFTCLFATLGLVASTPQAASGYGFIFLFVPYLSSAFVPTDTMPSWLQWVAENQPITPVIETIRGLLTGTTIGNSIWWAIGWCVLILIISLIWCGWAFHRKSGRR